MNSPIILLSGVRGGGKRALDAAVRAAVEAPAVIAGPDDVRALLTLDAEFAETGETTLVAAQVQRLVDIGWLEQGDEPNEITISEAGNAVLIAIDADMAAREAEQAEQEGEVAQ